MKNRNYVTTVFVGIYLALLTTCTNPLIEIIIDDVNIPVPGIVGEEITNNTTPTWDWEEVEKAVRYRYGFSESDWITEAATDTEYTPEEALSEGVYTFYLQSGTADGRWSESVTFTTIIDLTPPGEVQNLKIFGGDYELHLHWTDPNDEDLYQIHIEEIVEDGDGPVGGCGAGDEGASISILNDPADIVISAIDIAGNFSSGVTITTSMQVGSYESLQATASSGQVELTWSNIIEGDIPTTQIDHAELKYYPGGNTAVEFDLATTHTTITGLTDGTSYYFELSCVDEYGDYSFGRCSIKTPPYNHGDQETYSLGGVDFNMNILGGKSYPYHYEEDDWYDTINHNFFLAETEVTYELWDTVYQWATTDTGGGKRADGGELYTFANTGIMGDGSGDTDQHPVTTVNWRDAIIWCNALTEYYNSLYDPDLDCVYCADSDYATPIRAVDDSETIDDPDPGSQDDPYIRRQGGGGFRLPESKEYTLAARYIEDKNNNGDISDSGEYYPNHYVSGADARYDVTSGASDYDGDGDVEYTADVAVYTGNSGSSTAVVKSKSPNQSGIYDICGNVSEWTSDSDYLDAETKNVRGGFYSSWASGLAIPGGGENSSDDPYAEGPSLGFRIAITPPGHWEE